MVMQPKMIRGFPVPVMRGIVELSIRYFLAESLLKHVGIDWDTLRSYIVFVTGKVRAEYLVFLCNSPS